MQYPRVSEEHESLSSPLGIASALSTGLLVDTNLETSILDIYRPPPSPIPYDANQRCPLLGNQEFSGNKSEGTVRTTGTEPVEATNTIITHESTKMPNKSEGEVQTNIELASLKELEEELEKFGELKKFSEPIVSELEEEVVYPTFLEGGSSAFDTAIFILSVGYAIRHIAPNIIWTVGSWTAYLISVLYVEYRTKKEKENVNFKNHVIQWVEVLDGLLGPYWKAAGLAFNRTFLLFGSVIQLIACASNIYYINDHMDKRTWTYIFGACCATTVFIPSFHNYQIWSFLGLGMTTYTAWCFLKLRQRLGK